VTSLVGGPWFDIAATSRSIAILAAPPPHHGTLLELLGGRSPTKSSDVAAASH
jgi:hypothetical protein